MSEAAASEPAREPVGVEAAPLAGAAAVVRRLGSLAGTIGVSLGVFGLFAVQGVILARMLGPTGRGEFAVANLYAQSLLYLGMMGAPEVFARLAALGRDPAAVRRAAARYALLAGAVTFAACSLLSAATLPAAQRSLLPLAVLCAAAAAPQQLRLAVQGVDHGLRAMRRYNAGRLLGAAAFPAALAASWLIGYRSVGAACWTLLVASCVAAALCQWGMRGSWLGPPAVPLGRSLREGRAVTASIAANEAMERLDMLLIAWLVSGAALGVVGEYAAAVPVASAMLIIPNAAGLYIFNRAARGGDEQPRERELWAALAGLVAVQLVAGLLFAAALPYLLPWLYGERFEEATAFAIALLPAAAIRGLLQAADAYLRARGRAAASIPPRVVGCGVIVAVSLLARPALGAMAVPLGLNLAQVLCLVWIVFVLHREVRRGAAGPSGEPVA